MEPTKLKIQISIYDITKSNVQFNIKYRKRNRLSDWR